jgi:hypothetical protein
MPPEMLCNNTYDYLAADVWSLGISILYIIIEKTVLDYD